jgi:uncharacterized membrane protein YeaQ/YmgE (transglycosylase-associated protein family)
MSSALWLLVAVVVVLLALKMTGGLVSLVTSLLVGAAAGWLAGQFMRGRGFGALKNILLGILGAMVGGILFSLVGLHQSGIVASLITATVGAVVILYCVRWIQAS